MNGIYVLCICTCLALSLDRALLLPSFCACPYIMPVTAHFLQLTVVPDQVTKACIFRGCIFLSAMLIVMAARSSAQARLLVV